MARQKACFGWPGKGLTKLLAHGGIPLKSAVLGRKAAVDHEKV